MASPARIAFIGNSLPRRCGIATFTSDLESAVRELSAQPYTGVVAMTDPGGTYVYPPTVIAEIQDSQPEAYVQAAARLNREPWNVVSLQHEFGIFGGEAGAHVLSLINRLDAPIVTTLHTVLEHPTDAQRAVMANILSRSARVVVMAEKGRALLKSVYGAPAEKIRVIPHGIPDVPFAEPDEAKARLGFAGRTVILTFGLLSPGKGIEVMIDALPRILESTPDAVYVVLGATHPNLLREEGDVYRQRLQDRAAELGLQDHVVFLNQFVDKPQLLDFISACDIYVTPYLNPCQMTSGTLAYSFGLGKVVVSTPYWHAQELLQDGRGVLTAFGDAKALGREIASLLMDPDRRMAMRKNAYAQSRSMTWARTAQTYLELFEEARFSAPVRRPNPALTQLAIRDIAPLPPMTTQYFMSMCDDTGLFQHAVHSVPDRLHGYCVDDNARALLVTCALNDRGEAPMAEPMAARFASFIQHAWNPDIKRFRNFMSFGRQWVEEQGSEDSHGRTLWALGQCALSDACPSRRTWAAHLFRQALPTVLSFTSPRAWAFALIGLDPYCTAHPAYSQAHTIRAELAERLMHLLDKAERPGWTWFESGLSYDNPRLCQALILTGEAEREPRYVDAGLRTLRWLTNHQTAPSGVFRPVGSDSFGDHHKAPKGYDQQPLEAAAAIAACLCAWRADGDPDWKIEAGRAFAWFTGANDLRQSVVDTATGSCRDGLHPGRRNENRGGESAVSYLLALAEMRKLRRGARSVPLLAINPEAVSV